jgi:uncharacterized membrane protein
VLEVQDSSIGILISVPLSLPLLVPMVALSDQLPDVIRFPWQSYLWLSAAGIFFFVVGRTLIYRCSQLLGANITSILIRTSVIFSVIIGIVFLKEPLNWRIGAGVLLITMGICRRQVIENTCHGPFAGSGLRVFYRYFVYFCQAGSQRRRRSYGRGPGCIYRGYNCSWFVSF